MRYGVPYKGSKNQIAKWVVSVLPPAQNFYDLFAGGCAVTHAAMLSGKYQHCYANDLDDAPSLFFDAIKGKYKNEKRWISREDFRRLRDVDKYVRLCWSFGNNQKHYLYSREIEPWKKALHYARVYGDYSLLREMGIEGTCTRLDIKVHQQEYAKKYAAWYGENIRLERLASLERLEVTQLDYKDVKIKPNSIIYCDIPYQGTRGEYRYSIDYAEFYAWCKTQTELVVVSSYELPADFVEVASKAKSVLSSGKGTKGKITERLYVPAHQHELYLSMSNQGLFN